MLLDLATSRRTHNHMLLSHLDSPNLEGQVLVFISRGQLVLAATNSFFVISYDLQGYGGSILTRLYIQL
jgi:hypothetical protein